MPRNEMPADPIAQGHRKLQVHRAAAVQIGGPGQRLFGQIRLKTRRLDRGHGQATTVDGNAVADLQAGGVDRRGLHAQPQAALARLDLLDASDGLNDSGEHGRWRQLATEPVPAHARRRRPEPPRAASAALPASGWSRQASRSSTARVRGPRNCAAFAATRAIAR